MWWYLYLSLFLLGFGVMIVTVQIRKGWKVGLGPYGTPAVVALALALLVIVFWRRGLFLTADARSLIQALGGEVIDQDTRLTGRVLKVKVGSLFLFINLDNPFLNYHPHMTTLGRENRKASGVNPWYMHSAATVTAILPGEFVEWSGADGVFENGKFTSDEDAKERRTALAAIGKAWATMERVGDGLMLSIRGEMIVVSATTGSWEGVECGNRIIEVVVAARAFERTGIIKEKLTRSGGIDVIRHESGLFGKLTHTYEIVRS